MRVRITLLSGEPMEINVEPWQVQRFRCKGLRVQRLSDVAPFIVGAFSARERPADA